MPRYLSLLSIKLIKLFNFFIMAFLEYITLIIDKKRRAFVIFLVNYKQISYNNEVFFNKNIAILRLKN